MKWPLADRADATKQARQWKRSINREVRTMERQIQSLEIREKKLTKEIKQLAKAGQYNARCIRILAKELIVLRTTVSRLYEGKAQLRSVNNLLAHQLAMIKVSGVIQKSTEMLAAIGDLVKIPEVQTTIQQLAVEMEKAGLVEEIMDDGVSIMDGDGLDAQADHEVDRVIQELTEERLEGAVDAPTAVPEPPSSEAASPNETKGSAGIQATKARLA